MPLFQPPASGDTAAHIADATDAHDASAVSFDDTGLGITAADVQTMGEQLDAAIAAGGIPATIFDAAGDIIVASAADTATRLAKGADGTFLGVVAGALAYATPGGGGTLSTLGTTGMGASFQGARATYFKKITVAATCELISIVIGIKGDAAAFQGIGVAVYSDSAGSPVNLIAGGNGVLVNDSSAYATGYKLNATARLVTLPIGAILTAADYHLAVKMFGGGDSQVLLAYAAGTGSDRTQAAITSWDDSSVTASSSGTNDHTIYANIRT